MLERLQKIIADAGVTSRRKAEALLLQGLVKVNGQVVTRLGAKADPARDHIKVNGKLLRGLEKPIALLLYKPRGYVTTVSDPLHRPTVMDLVKKVKGRLCPVGRLDIQTSGLLVLTNDGELTQHLTAAAFHVPKTYQVRVRGWLDSRAVDRLQRGIVLEGRRTAPCTVRLLPNRDNPWYEITLFEGRHHQVRRMFESVGHPVVKLSRVRIGCLTGKGLRAGQFRHLKPAEIARLKNWKN